MTDSTCVTLELLAAKLNELLDIAKRGSARFLTVQGAAEHSSLSPESIRRLISAGKLTALRPVRGRVLIDRRQLDSVVLSATQRPRRGRGIR